MKKSKIEKIALEKQKSREIVKEIENFGVTDSQKIDIIYFLSMTIKDNTAMKEICNFIKNYKKNINNIEESNNNKTVLNKIIVE